MKTNPKGLVRMGTLFTGLLLLAASPAFPASLAAGPLTVPYDESNTNALDCAIANVGNSPITVTITATFVGVRSNIGRNFVLAPGEADSVGFGDSSVTEPALGYCKFEFTGRPSNVRATACVLDGFNTCVSAVRAY
jgi:hypothetical protein